MGAAEKNKVKSKKNTAPEGYDEARRGQKPNNVYTKVNAKRMQDEGHMRGVAGDMLDAAGEPGSRPGGRGD